MKTTINYKTSSARRARLQLIGWALGEAEAMRNNLSEVRALNERDTLDAIIDSAFETVVSTQNQATTEETGETSE